MMELRAKEPYKLTFDIKAERERTLSSLPVTFQVSPVAGMGVNGGMHGCGCKCVRSQRPSQMTPMV